MDPEESLLRPESQGQQAFVAEAARLLAASPWRWYYTEAQIPELYRPVIGRALFETR